MKVWGNHLTPIVSTDHWLLEVKATSGTYIYLPTDSCLSGKTDVSHQFLKKTCVPGHIPSTRSKCSHDHSPYTPHVFHWFIFILPSYQISVISRLEEMYELQIPLNRCQIFLKMRLLFAACCQTAICYRCSPTKSRPLLTDLNRQKRNSPSERAAFGRWC